MREKFVTEQQREDVVNWAEQQSSDSFSYKSSTDIQVGTTSTKLRIGKGKQLFIEEHFKQNLDSGGILIRCCKSLALELENAGIVKFLETRITSQRKLREMLRNPTGSA